MIFFIKADLYFKTHLYCQDDVRLVPVVSALICFPHGYILVFIQFSCSCLVPSHTSCLFAHCSVLLMFYCECSFELEIRKGLL